ncbi:MAG: NVEALA domain-containing protein [Prevotellaceae bacterium]|jgi:hypothetical protein|nr:NVEALA domain-containing protein [Prevotellaceae bacterium]
MKKYILGGIAAVVIAVLAGVNVNLNSQDNELSAISLANVEALAQGEGGSGCGFAAYEYNNNWYEDTKTFRRCGDCTWVSGTSPQYTNC